MCSGKRPRLRYAAAVVIGLPLFAAATYQAEIAAWRHEREAHLRADGGWLTVTGLFWLHEGRNTFGTDPKSDIVLPAGPAQAGIFDLHNGNVTATTAGSTRNLHPDSDDFVSAGRLRLYVIDRAGRIGIRLKDPQSPYLRDFHGIEAFPAREEYRILARFVPEPKKVPITNIIGQTEPEDSPGYVVFRLQGREYRLRPVIDEPGSRDLFFIFRDLTGGHETYGAGRFLDTPPPQNGQVVLDFNKAYNPPCAFTPYATCPLPPKENRLPVRIEAGEKKYGH
ncbi:MAG TPA: DUF1684 domain-containing protein [Bryobacteraceae bacterium]|nr:DUF1684 domain-containing protein [Bryobacteraceae bacterium]